MTGLRVSLRLMAMSFFYVDLALVVAWLLLDTGPSIRGLSVGASILVAGWWATPYLTLLGLRRMAALVATGLLLLTATALGLSSIYSSPSSTAGIGFFTVPVLLWIVAMIPIAVQSVWPRARHVDRGRA